MPNLIKNFVLVNKQKARQKVKNYKKTITDLREEFTNKKTGVKTPYTSKVANFKENEVRKAFDARAKKLGLKTSERGYKAKYQKFKNDLRKKVEKNRILSAKKKLDKLVKTAGIDSQVQSRFKGDIADNFKGFKKENQYKKFMDLAKKFEKNQSVDNIKNMMSTEKNDDIKKLSNLNDYVNARLRGDYEFYNENRDLIQNYNTIRQMKLDKYGSGNGDLANATPIGKMLKNKYENFLDTEANKQVDKIKTLIFD